MKNKPRRIHNRRGKRLSHSQRVRRHFAATIMFAEAVLFRAMTAVALRRSQRAFAPGGRAIAIAGEYLPAGEPVTIGADGIARRALPTPCHASKIPPLTAEDIVCFAQAMPASALISGEVIKREGNTITFKHGSDNRYWDGVEQKVTIVNGPPGGVTFPVVDPFTTFKFDFHVKGYEDNNT